MYFDTKNYLKIVTTTLPNTLTAWWGKASLTRLQVANLANKETKKKQV
jgi:hypothetical protein